MCTFFDDFSVTMDICAQLFVQKQYINRIFSDKNLLEMTIVANDAAPTDAGAIQLERRHLPGLAVKDRKIVKFPAKQHGRRQRGGRKNGKKTLKTVGKLSVVLLNKSMNHDGAPANTQCRAGRGDRRANVVFRDNVRTGYCEPVDFQNL